MYFLGVFNTTGHRCYDDFATGPSAADARPGQQGLDLRPVAHQDHVQLRIGPNG